eukprot:Amastigsp_a177795_45.p3 type:complete len:101 gc:universal Amastigsp_a177795_45:283-585(+)
MKDCDAIPQPERIRVVHGLAPPARPSSSALACGRARRDASGALRRAVAAHDHSYSAARMLASTETSRGCRQHARPRCSAGDRLLGRPRQVGLSIPLYELE